MRNGIEGDGKAGVPMRLVEVRKQSLVVKMANVKVCRTFCLAIKPNCVFHSSDDAVFRVHYSFGGEN